MTTQAEEYGLKPCPFCGSRSLLIERDYPPSDTPALDNEWVECLKCGATGPWHRVSRTHQAVIRDWNYRVDNVNKVDKAREKKQDEWFDYFGAGWFDCE